jgi:hypothetical protein
MIPPPSDRVSNSLNRLAKVFINLVRCFDAFHGNIKKVRVFIDAQFILLQEIVRVEVSRDIRKQLQAYTSIGLAAVSVVLYVANSSLTIASAVSIQSFFQPCC